MSEFGPYSETHQARNFRRAELEDVASWPCNKPPMPHYPIIPEQVYSAVEIHLMDAQCNRIVIQTRYGSVELPVDEIWTADKTVHISVNLPETP